ncbi:MAG: GOLPH3/VPS74 family protein, partial [Pseudonocardiaceae bacterium]
MTTPRDLLMVALDMESGPPEQGDLSLALAGAEVIDLLDVQAIRLDGERIVPVHRPATGDRLLDEAASSLVRQEPYESVGDWLWRRGRGLFSSYLAALEAEGLLTPQRLR